MSFVHLHVHSQYSFLDGASTVDALLEKARALNMPALAITDHNRLTGAIRFYEKARKIGIKPIIGVETILEGVYHLTLLCKNSKGCSNLCRLLTDAHLSTGGGNPQATRDMLQKYGGGIIALSGCGKGEIPTLVSKGKAEHASIQMTLDTYSHVAPGLQQAAAERFDQALNHKAKNEAVEKLR